MVGIHEVPQQRTIDPKHFSAQSPKSPTNLVGIALLPESPLTPTLDGAAWKTRKQGRNWSEQLLRECNKRAAMLRDGRQRSPPSPQSALAANILPVSTRACRLLPVTRVACRSRMQRPPGHMTQKTILRQFPATLFQSPGTAQLQNTRPFPRLNGIVARG